MLQAVVTFFPSNSLLVYLESRSTEYSILGGREKTYAEGLLTGEANIDRNNFQINWQYSLDMKPLYQVSAACALKWLTCQPPAVN